MSCFKLGLPHVLGCVAILCWMSGCEETGKRYTLTIDSGPDATVTLDPPWGRYEPGTLVGIYVTPDSGREFVQILWDDGTCSSSRPGESSRPPVVLMYEDMRGTVVLSSPGKYALRIWAYTYATVAFDPPDGTYDPGTTVTITVTPRPGASFWNIQWDDTTRTYDNPDQVTMDRDKWGMVDFYFLP